MNSVLKKGLVSLDPFRLKVASGQFLSCSLFLVSSDPHHDPLKPPPSSTEGKSVPLGVIHVTLMARECNMREQAMFAMCSKASSEE